VNKPWSLKLPSVEYELWGDWSAPQKGKIFLIRTGLDGSNSLNDMQHRLCLGVVCQLVSGHIQHILEEGYLPVDISMMPLTSISKCSSLNKDDDDFYLFFFFLGMVQQADL